MSKSLLGLEASNAIVVGAGQGGGRGIALQLARAGANVAVVDLDAGRAEAVAAEVREIGSESISIAADATDATSVAEMLARTRGELGPVRTAVNNVGSYGSHRPAGFVDLEWDFWQTAIDLNVKSTFLCSRECARSMQDDGVDGAIVNIASLSGMRASPNLAPYGAVKAAVMHMTQTLALELAPRGIRVNAVAPTAIESPSLAEGISPEFMEALRESIPMQRLCSIEELGDCVVMLASQLSRFVTGQVIACDGGASVTTRRAEIPPGEGHRESPGS
ncbi:MAG: SDR family oxidoreductase [Myxococcales bacterium]|nr:SDR family oxidoreductase [Myxococcales bacterium]